VTVFELSTGPSLDVLVICCEAKLSDKLAFIAYALEHKKYIIETSADPVTIQGLLDHLPLTSHHLGYLLIGMGVFPGLSNLMISEMLRTSLPSQSLSILARTSPFAGAGKNMCQLMTDLLRSPSARYNSDLRAFEFNFPEKKMFMHSDGFDRLSTFYQSSPPIMNHVIALLLKLKLLNQKFIGRLTQSLLFFMRGSLLKSQKTALCLRGFTHSKDGTYENVMDISYSDGIELACLAILYACLNPPKDKGTYCPQDIYQLKDLLKWNTPKLKHQLIANP